MPQPTNPALASECPDLYAAYAAADTTIAILRRECAAARALAINSNHHLSVVLHYAGKGLSAYEIHRITDLAEPSVSALLTDAYAAGFCPDLNHELRDMVIPNPRVPQPKGAAENPARPPRQRLPLADSLRTQVRVLLGDFAERRGLLISTAYHSLVNGDLVLEYKPSASGCPQ